MKPLIDYAAANSPTCHVCEADATKKQKCKFNKTKDNGKTPVSCTAGRQRRWGTNLLNLLPQPSLYPLANRSNHGTTAALFLRFFLGE
jgi:hypothetical protein